MTGDIKYVHFLSSAMEARPSMFDNVAFALKFDMRQSDTQHIFGSASEKVSFMYMDT